MQSRLFLCPLAAEECIQIQHFNITYNLANWANSIYRKSKRTKILLNYTHPRSMMLELSEIWNFHRHCGKLLLVCFNTRDVSISWPIRMAAVGEAVDLCLQSQGSSSDKGTHTAVNYVWTLSIQLTHHSLFSLLTGGKSTLKCPKHWNTWDLLNKTNSTSKAQGCLQAYTRQSREGTF